MADEPARNSDKLRSLQQRLAEELDIAKGRLEGVNVAIQTLDHIERMAIISAQRHEQEMAHEEERRKGKIHG